ncbi:MAG: hydroxymethylglutaryl-CoA lyase, partial [Candidatus Eremiobacteraeota bacterium]|nr:hydroxymethylglutaryl-CoA lyase [Candidatus Eremiobacteraeota bacterium]
MESVAVPKSVKVCEVGPRDGLQNESVTVPAEVKVRYIDLLTESGLQMIEATSFVSPKAIPQLADSAEVYRAINKRRGVRYVVLCPNLRGLERAREAGVDSIAVFTAASETFTKRNINMTIDESLRVFGEVISEARSDGMWVRGYISTAFGCPYEGAVPIERVVTVTAALFELGCDEISIGDTIGVGVPTQVDALIPRLSACVPLEKIALHFHDTRGTALANVHAALQHGVGIFDSSAGGLGGCPYAPGASGNLGTEDLLYMLHGMGIQTRVDLAAVRAASRFIAGALNHAPTSKTFL